MHSTYLDEWAQAARPRDILEDPVRRHFQAAGAPPDLDAIRCMLSPTVGDPAFDHEVIAGNIERLRTRPDVSTGHPFLDLSVATGLAFVDATFQGDHPKYGLKGYARNTHDGFPPTIIAAVDALSAWGLAGRAAQLFRYWLLTFVRDDGSIAYYGPSISEYGQLLHTAACLEERAGPAGWWDEGFAPLERIAEFLLRARAAAEGWGGLIAGAPEADERKAVGTYFHNNAWAARGLARWAELCDRRGATPSTGPDRVRDEARALAAQTLEAISRTWPDDQADWWLPPQAEPVDRPECLTGTRVSSYTNYRYWPELLSSGVLPTEMANRVVDARLRAGGQFCGMARFGDHLDDWPLADYLYGLWALGRRDDFLLSLYGHVAYHQAAGHMTAYEQISLPADPRRRGCAEKAAYCLPCQLVAARAGRLLVG